MDGCSVPTMSSSMKKFGIDRLGVDERLALLEEIWESLDEQHPELTEAQRSELQKRLADDDANPDDVVPWEDVKRMYPPSGGK
jgi:putative addiction module component (TIGR02574 family)